MIRGIVFDLDGTLWNTEDAYIDAYHKLVKEFSLTPLPDEEVKSCLGLKLEDTIKKLFVDCPDVKNAAYLAVKYVGEYCSKNPHYYSKDLVGIFKNLSKQYDLYIMSNCPRNFLDNFLKVSGISEYLIDTFSITEGTKKEHLKKLSNNHTERLLFVGDSQFDYDDIENHKCINFCFAKYGYMNCSNYDYHINTLDEIVPLMEKISTKERMIDLDDYEIFSCGDTNVTVINFENYSMFGFIEFNNKNEFNTVLKSMINSKKKKLIGPIDGKTWYSYRLCLDNFDWKLYPDCLSNKEIIDSLYENGFKLYHTYSSTLSHINEKIWKLAKRTKLLPDYSTMIVRGNKVLDYLKDIYEIGTNVFINADYYRPISFEDFKDIYIKGLNLINPVLVLIMKNNNLVAFNYAYEDPEKRFYICKTIGIKEEERNKIVLLKLLDASYDFMVSQGYDLVLHHFQNDRTKTMESLSVGYGVKKKQYGLFKYENQ